MSAEDTAETVETPAAKRRRRGLHVWALIACAVSLVVLVLAAGTARFGVQTDPGRAFVVRLLQGMKVGRLGRLQIEGLQGDVFGAFTIRRLSIVDRQGPWIEANNLAVSWRPTELAGRRVHLQRVRAVSVRVLRRPVPEPPSGEPGRPMPVSILVDELRTGVETLPAFSVRRGVWDLSGQLELRRGGATSGRLDAQSRLHLGDGVRAAFRFEPAGRMLLQADAVEAAGGALAGSLGLAANERLFVRARVDGVVDGDGRISIQSESGPLRPIVAEGGWGRSGATLDARLLLAASSLTRGYAERVGPEARIQLRATHVRGDVYTLDGAALARDAQVYARGPLDWRRRRTDGMALRVNVASLQRWVEAIQAGPTRMAGTISGDLVRWRYQGQVQVERLDQFGYRLATLRGPATISQAPGEHRLQANLAGAGGSGQGLIPALLGAQPRLRLDGARLRDGRLLARALHVDGSGLALDATGDRSLFGALSFRGTLALSNLQRAHGGARGVIEARFSAGQRGRSPWSVNFDARGREFASGYPELDRLLGPAPRFAGDATYGGEGLALLRSQLNGQAAQAAIRGMLDQRNTLAMDIDWSARGPFTAGPVEIAGEARGVGRLVGPVATPRVDLTADLASVDFGRLAVAPARLVLGFDTAGGFAGNIALSGPSAYGPASAKAGFRFVEGGVALNDILADAGGVKAHGALTLTNGAPSTADLTLSVGPGAVLSAGQLNGTLRIVQQGGGAVARISLDGENVAAPGVNGTLKTLRLRADGPWNRLPFDVSAESDTPVAWRFGGQGVLTQADQAGGTVREVSLTGAGRVRRADVRLLEPAVLRFGPGGRAARLRASVGAGRVDLDLQEAGAGVQVRGNVQNLELAPFAEDYVGRLTAALNLSGAGQRLEGTLDASLQGGRNRDAPENVALNGRMRAVLADTRVRIEASATNPQGLTSNLNLDVPAEATAAPFRVALIRNRPVSGSFAAEGEVRPLWDLFVGGGRALSGRANVQGTLGGTLADLNPRGQATLANGRFEDAATGLELRDLTVAAGFGANAISVRQFTGADGQGGSLSGSGEISLARDGGSTFRLQLQRFQLIDNDLARAVASGEATVTRDAAGKARIVGALIINRADITAEPPVPSGVIPLDVIEINRPQSERAEFRVRPRGPEIALDVKITAPRGVFVRGNGLDIEFSVDAHVGGATGATALTGTARVVRGDYQFAGKRFEFDERSVVRLGSRAETIRLDLTATRDDPALTAVVRIEGTAARPEITLSSNPVLPQDEVLSQVLFGRSASQLSPLETAQLAAGVTALASGGGFDVLGGLREFAGLDRLAFGGDASGAATVSGGKYVTDDVYLELTGGGRQGPTAQVEWRVRRNFSIVSTIGSRGDARLSVRFRRNY